MSEEQTNELIEYNLDYSIEEDLEETKKCLKEANEEIERLNNKVEELMELYTTERHCKDDYKFIIKELREYIETELWNYFNERNIYLKVRDSFLEILDKGE